MNTYKVVQDSKREEFRKYLEKNGVMDALTRCLVSLYEEPEKPADPLEYVRRTLGAATPDRVELDSLRVTVAEMKEKMTVMEEENRDLHERLQGLGLDGEALEGGEQGQPGPATAEPAAQKPDKERK